MDKQNRAVYQKSYQKKYKAKHKTVSVSLTKSDYKRLEEAAKQAGVTKLATMMRQLTFSALDGDAILPESIAEGLKEHNMLLRNIANNINQIAHASNIFHDAEREAVMDELRDLQQLVADFIADKS